MIRKGDASFWYENWSGRGPLYMDVSYVHISNLILCMKDIWHDGNWCLNRLSTSISNEVAVLIRSVSI